MGLGLEQGFEKAGWWICVIFDRIFADENDENDENDGCFTLFYILAN